MIIENTDLIGDVTCDVGNNTPWFSFGAPNVEPRLSGFSITGRGDAVTGCGGAAFDILNLAPAGQTTFERNVCITAQNAPCPAPALRRPQ